MTDRMERIGEKCFIGIGQMEPMGIYQCQRCLRVVQSHGLPVCDRCIDESGVTRQTDRNVCTD